MCYNQDMKENDNVVRRNYKDSVFCRLFSERENALSLYNALCGESEDDATSLEIVTLENAVYLSRKNDCAVCVHSSIALFEQQSTWNPNMPLRGMIYFAAEYSAWLAKYEKDIYSHRLIKIPAPQYFVLYNGEEMAEEKVDLRLSDAFEKASEGYEWTAHAVNVNAGHNRDILEKCKVLGDYAYFVAAVRRKKSEGLETALAVDKAIEECIERGILKDFLLKHKTEVSNMFLFEYDEELHTKALKREAFEEGRENGIAQGREQGIAQGREQGIAQASIQNLMRKMNVSVQQAMDMLDIKAEERTKYAAMLH